MSAYEIGDIDTKIKQIFEKDKKKSLETLVKILTNIDENPSEKKYRALKKTNAAFAKVVADIPDTMWFLKIAGFVDNADVVVCPENADIERLREVLNNIKSAILIYESINPINSIPNPYANPNPLPTTSTFPSSVNNVNNANLPTLASQIANAALFKDWSDNMTKGENEFIKSKNVMTALQFFEKAVRTANQIYEQEKTNFYAGVLCAVSYASLADCYYVNGHAEQCTDCALIGKHYLNTTMAENANQVFNPEVHMHLSKIYLLLAKASFAGVSQQSLAGVETCIAVAWRHAQMSPAGMPKVIAEHNVACWSMRFYKSLSSQGMNYNEQFTRWYLIHEAVKHGHL